MPGIHRITPCLWFYDQAVQAAGFYTAIFRNSRILNKTLYGEAGREIHGQPPGSVMTVSFELDGQGFTALNGGPAFRFNEAISFQVTCDTQQEMDYYWEKLSDGGDEMMQKCGWLRDKYGVSWQIVPVALLEMLADTDPEKSQRVTAALLRMKRIDLRTLKQAYAGSSTGSVPRSRPRQRQAHLARPDRTGGET